MVPVIVAAPAPATASGLPLVLIGPPSASEPAVTVTVELAWRVRPAARELFPETLFRAPTLRLMVGVAVMVRPPATASVPPLLTLVTAPVVPRALLAPTFTVPPWMLMVPANAGLSPAS